MGGGSSSGSVGPKDVVLLHQFPRGKMVPSPSPFALKLETWLRMADIKYENKFGMKFSKKGKIPWIELNGEEMADSQFCIEYLSKKNKIDLNAHLSPTDAAVARAFLKMTDESMFWCMALQRFVFNPSTEQSGIPKLFLLYAGRKVKKNSKCQGYGLHSQEEIYRIGKADLKSLDTFIGNKKFLFGEKVCDVDAAVFGSIVEFYYTDKGVFHQYMESECPNLMRYMQTIKKTYWPDWDDCLAKPK